MFNSARKAVQAFYWVTLIVGVHDMSLLLAAARPVKQEVNASIAGIAAQFNALHVSDSQDEVKFPSMSESRLGGALIKLMGGAYCGFYPGVNLKEILKKEFKELDIVLSDEVLVGREINSFYSMSPSSCQTPFMVALDYLKLPIPGRDSKLINFYCDIIGKLLKSKTVGQTNLVWMSGFLNKLSESVRTSARNSFLKLLIKDATDIPDELVNLIHGYCD